MPLLVHNKSASPITLAGMSVVVPPGVAQNITSELKNKTVSQRMALEKQRGTSLVYRWSGVTEYDVFPLRTSDYKEVADTASLLYQFSELDEVVQRLSNENRVQKRGMSGDMELAIIGQELASDVSAAALNAAAAGTFKRTFVAALRTKVTKESHNWSNSPMVVTSGEAVADVNVGVPVVTPASPKFDSGRLLLTVTFDTDAGATKTYVAAESVTVEVKVAADNKLLGFTVASVTKTFNVVA